MKRFESYISQNGEITISLPDSGEQFLLDSPKGLEFAAELINELSKQYPTMIKAVEQKIKLMNKQVYALMKTNRKVHVERISHMVCSCCFGELGETLDYDGNNFNMEYPRQCRDMKFCPWNGYAERNKDSFMVICGAKREFGLSPQERRVCHLIQKGFTAQSTMADVMQLTSASIHKFLNKIYSRTNTAGMPDLVNQIGRAHV